MLYYAKTLVYIDTILLIAFLAYRSALLPSLKGSIQNRILLIVLFTPLVALFCRNLYIFYAYLFVVAAFGARRKSDLCPLYLVLITLCPSLHVELSVGSVYLMGVTSMHFINLGALLGYFITRGKAQPGNRLLDLLIWVPVLLFALTSFWDYKIQSFIRLLISNAMFIVPPYFLVSRLIRSREDVDKAMIHFLLAAFLASATAIFEAVRMWPLYQAYDSALNMQTGMSKTLAVRGGALRAMGALGDYTALGMYLAVALSVVPGVWRSFRRPARFGVLAVIGMGLLATQSRGAWIGGAAGLAMMLIGRRKLGALFTGGVAVAVAVAAKSFSGDGPIGGAHGAQTAEYRLELLQRGSEEVMKYPLFGANPTVLQNDLADLVQGQGIIDFVNSHLHIALTSGLVGLSVWCVMWLVPAAMGWRAARGVGRRLAYPPSLVPTAILAASFVTLIFTSMVDRNLTWVALALGFVVPTVAATRAEAAELAGRQQPGGAARVSRPGLQGRRLPRPAILLPH